jgi:hypothetical protein
VAPTKGKWENLDDGCIRAIRDDPLAVAENAEPAQQKKSHAPHAWIFLRALRLTLNKNCSDPKLQISLQQGAEAGAVANRSPAPVSLSEMHRRRNLRDTPRRDMMPGEFLVNNTEKWWFLKFRGMDPWQLPSFAAFEPCMQAIH